MPKYKIRPHHGLCTAFFIGKGYSSEFTANMSAMIKMLGNDDPIVEISPETDIICRRCPNNQNGKCTSEKVCDYDNRVLHETGITAGSIMRWSKFKSIVSRCILEKNKLNTICGNCRWYDICSNIKT